MRVGELERKRERHKHIQIFINLHTQTHMRTLIWRATTVDISCHFGTVSGIGGVRYLRVFDYVSFVLVRYWAGQGE